LKYFGARIFDASEVHLMTTTELEPDPVISAYKRDIDRTLLRQNLKRSVAERLAALVALQRLAEEARQSRVTAEERRD